MKKVAIVVSGAVQGQNVRELEIQRGSTAGDVLRAAGLEGYLLSREGSGQYFGNEEPIYDAIKDGDKLRATPVAEVGATWLGRLLCPPPPQAVSPQRPSRRVARPSTQPYYEIRGWRRKGSRLIGAYRTPRGSCAGEIRLSRFAAPEYFIFNPPGQILGGRHGGCFRPRGGNRYWVHFSKPSRDVDAGIIQIEHFLTQALTGKAV